MKDRFIQIFKGKVVLVGIGNTLKGDDAFGPALVERLSGKVAAVCIDAGTAPENYTRKIVQEKPDTILLVDAVSLELPAGEYEILNKADIMKVGLTTHDISPRMFIEYLEQQTTAKIYLLGIQPQSLGLGEEMSLPVLKTLNTIAQTIEEVLHA
jgi:hydrogenase 3 maturation protease